MHARQVPIPPFLSFIPIWCCMNCSTRISNPHIVIQQQLHAVWEFHSYFSQVLIRKGGVNILERHHTTLIIYLFVCAHKVERLIFIVLVLVLDGGYCDVCLIHSFFLIVAHRAHRKLGIQIIVSGATADRSITMSGVYSVVVLRKIVLIFLQLPTIRLIVPNLAAVVALSFELASGIDTRIVIAITRPVFLGTLVGSMPLLLKVVKGASKGSQHHFTIVITCMFLLASTSLSPQLIHGIFEIIHGQVSTLGALF
jgi:hypothetical protein